MIDVTGVILAGGKSQRMGEDKRFVTVGMATLLDRCRMAMLRQFSDVLIITARDSPPLEGQGCRVYQDVVPDCGSLGGLYTGLYYATHRRIFVVACDMPFLDPAMIGFFVQRSPNADIVIGRLPHGLQPLHAVYGKRVLPFIERRANTGQLKIQNLVTEPSLEISVLDSLEWASIDPSSRSFRNVNTPADLEAARIELARASLAP